MSLQLKLWIVYLCNSFGDNVRLLALLCLLWMISFTDLSDVHGAGVLFVHRSDNEHTA